MWVLGTSSILVYIVRPVIPYFFVSRASWYLVLPCIPYFLDIWYLVVFGIFCVRTPCFLVSHTSLYLVLLAVSDFLVSRTSWYLTHPGIAYFLVSRNFYYLARPGISYFPRSRTSPLLFSSSYFLPDTSYVLVSCTSRYLVLPCASYFSWYFFVSVPRGSSFLVLPNTCFLGLHGISLYFLISHTA